MDCGLVWTKEYKNKNSNNTIVRLNKRGKKSGCIWQPAQLYRVRITMPMLSIAFLHWFATFQTQTSSTVKSNSTFQGLVYSNFLPPLFNPSIGCLFTFYNVYLRCYLKHSYFHCCTGLLTIKAWKDITLYFIRLNTQQMHL